jgi:uncharacterized protein YecT (DUF1311 family)
MSIAAQVFTELSDEQFAALYNRIVREGKFRRTVDFRALVKKTQRAWASDKERQAKLKSTSEVRNGLYSDGF